jgi:hypothetical protein
MTNHDNSEAQQILDAMRTIQSNPELQAEAQTQPDSLFDRLKLSGVARHAVALAIAGVIIAGTQPPIVQPDSIW